MAVSAYWSEVPFARLAPPGVSCTAVSTGAPTVSEAVADRPAASAVTVTAAACARPVARPEAEIETAADDALHDAATGPPVPSVYVTVAVSCWLVPLGMETGDGETASEAGTAG